MPGCTYLKDMYNPYEIQMFSFKSGKANYPDHPDSIIYILLNIINNKLLFFLETVDKIKQIERTR